ncbi:heparanase-like [Diadema antillarum]|uniref:heparanase-like n=1 Tax=Diadema antillarum TaxID=105358 RepID=UPI003A8455A4
MKVTADQVARDFLTLRKLLSEIDDAGLLVGPDITHLPLNLTVDDGLEAPFVYLERFLRKAGSALNATTLHYYNVHKDKTTTIENFTDPEVLDRIEEELRCYTDVVKHSMERPVERWIGEGSSVTSGGLINASSRFAAGFPSSYKAGAVTLIVLNLLKDTTAVMRLSGLQSKISIDEYLLTPFGGSLDSDSIELNGKVLSMIDDSILPDTPPRPLPPGSPISLPSRTYGFYVIKDARAVVCIKSRGGSE